MQHQIPKYSPGEKVRLTANEPHMGEYRVLGLYHVSVEQGKITYIIQHTQTGEYLEAHQSNLTHRNYAEGDHVLHDDWPNAPIEIVGVSVIDGSPTGKTMYVGKINDQFEVFENCEITLYDDRFPLTEPEEELFEVGDKVTVDGKDDEGIIHDAVPGIILEMIEHDNFFMCRVGLCKKNAEVALCHFKNIRPRE